jgi:N-acetylmuramic acid 6-phosphate etherase
MTEDYPGTESLPQGRLSVDKMKTLDALKTMLRSQSETIEIVEKNLEKIEEIVELIFLKLKESKFGRIIYVGAGTSARIAVQDGVELFPTFGWPKTRVEFLIAGSLNALTQSIEGAEDDEIQAEKDVLEKLIKSNDVVIGVAASSNTPYTVSVIKKCQSLGALTVGIGNNINGKLQYFAEHSITLNTGPEIIAGSTRLKAGTAQKICLNLISSMVMVKMGFVKNGLMINLVPNNKKLLKRKAKIDKILSVLNK